MSITDLIVQLRALNLPLGQYAITASGPLAIRGLREANDLDIIVTGELWEDLKAQYQDYCVEEEKIILGDLEILGKNLRAHNEIFATAEQQLAETEIIDGLPCVKLQIIKEYKIALSREKDLEDIKLIESYLEDEIDAPSSEYSLYK